MDVLSIERARMRIERLLGKLDDWETMVALIVGDIRDPQKPHHNGQFFQRVSGICARRPR